MEYTTTDPLFHSIEPTPITPNTTMTELTDLNDPTPDLTEDEKDLLREAGASRLLIQVCEFDITTMDRLRRDGKAVYRNSVLEEAKKYVRGSEAMNPSLTEENVDTFHPYGGGFFMKVWNADLYNAYYHGDGNNKAILLEAFGVNRINRDRPSHRMKVTV